MSQKLVQFRGLCDKNIAAMDPNSEPDPFVPTSDDLLGFWEMVYIQVKTPSIAKKMIIFQPKIVPKRRA